MKAPRLLVAASVLAALVLAAPARAAVDAFIWFENAGGQSKDPGHRGWIEVETFQIEQFRNAATTIGSATGGAGAGKIKFNEFTIKKLTDASSPTFVKAHASGHGIPKMKLSVRKAGGSQEFLEIKLENVRITSYQLGASGGAAPETITLSFMYGTIEKSTGPLGTGRGQKPPPPPPGGTAGPPRT